MKPVQASRVASLSKDGLVPDHQLLIPIAEGSYGEVWLARSALGTFRAIKFVWRRESGDDAAIRRELRGIRKFEPISRSHPGFVNILQVGHDREERFFYYVMELGDDVSGGPAIVPGSYKVKTLEEVLRREHRLPADDVLLLGLRLSDALHHLHQAGLVHRDIKPANIIFVGGMPKLADIGLVTDQEDADSLVGTLGYIPAEGPGTPQADVFALGKVLYECLSGLDRSQFPNLPTIVDELPDRERFLEVNEVILKSCHPDAQRRYGTARQLHAELVAIENGTSLRRLRELERKWGRVKRVATVAAIAITFCIGAGVLVHRETMHRQVERQRLVGTFSVAATRAIDQWDYPAALKNIAQSIEALPGDRSERLQRMYYGSILGGMPKLTQFRSWHSMLTWCEFMPDDRRILVTMADGSCELVSVETGETALRFSGVTNGLLTAAVSPDGRLVATGGRDNAAKVWSAESGLLRLDYRHPCMVVMLRFSRDGKAVATGAEDGIIRCWSTEEEKALAEVKAHQGRIDCLAFGHHGDVLASAGRDKKIQLWRWEFNTLQRLGEPIKANADVLHLAFSHDDERLLASCSDGTARICSRPDRIWQGPAFQHEPSVRHSEFSPDERHVFTIGRDGTLRLWQASAEQLPDLVVRHSSAINCANFSNDGRMIVTACTDGSLRVWNLAGMSVPHLIQAKAVSPDGEFAAYVDKEAISIRGLGARQQPSFRVETAVGLRRLFVGPGARWLAQILTNRESVQVRLTEVHSGKTRGADVILQAIPSRCVWDPTGKWIALGGTNSVHLVSLADGKGMSLVREDIRDWAFSPSGRELALGFGNLAEVVSARDGHRLGSLMLHTTAVQRVRFSPDGNRLLTCTADSSQRACSAQIWDAVTGRPMGSPLWHKDGVTDGAWFPDGKRIVTVGEDRTGRLWEVKESRPLGAEFSHKEYITSVALGWDSRIILSASLDRTARLWDPETGFPISLPIHFPYSLESAHSIGDGSGFVAAELGGRRWVSSVLTPDWDVGTLIRLSDLMGGDLPKGESQQPFVAARLMEREWADLKRLIPAAFGVTVAEIDDWHKFEAEACRADKLERGELMHLQQLLKRHPEDLQAGVRQRQLEVRLNRSQPAARP